MKISIKPIMDEMKMSRYELAQKIEVTYPTITSIYNETSTSIKLDILEKICKVLNCTPNDILIFEDDNLIFENSNQKQTTEPEFQTEDVFVAMNPPE